MTILGRGLLFTLMALGISHCFLPNTKCCEYLSTFQLSKGLYEERYRTFCAGVWGEVIDCYVTDSVSYRAKIGSFDEHESLRAELKGDRIFVYNLRSALIADTVERRKIAKADLWKHHDSVGNCLGSKPLFGKNVIKCDTHFSPTSYLTDDGVYISEAQFHCGNDYFNAIYCTDSVNFSILMGFWHPGSFENNFKVSRNLDNSVDFFNITERRKIDTVKVESFLMSDLKKEGLRKVCN